MPWGGAARATHQVVCTPDDNGAAQKLAWVDLYIERFFGPDARKFAHA
jgi:hypothetical protein